MKKTKENIERKGKNKVKHQVKRSQGKWMTGLICLELLCIAGLLMVVWKLMENRHAQVQSENVVIQEDALLSAEAQRMNMMTREEMNQTSDEKKQVVGGEDILLVNKEHKLPEDYEVKLITLPDKSNRAAEEAYQPLMDMLNAGRKEGLSFEVCSSYRDVKRQQELFDEDVEALMRRGNSYKQAYDSVAKGTMPPGYSEHSTGLAFDIVALDYQMLDEGQEKTDENKWLRENCSKYGFILRYPKEAEDITGIGYESWHFRYVGVEAAEYITEHGLTLEEYLEG